MQLKQRRAVKFVWNHSVCPWLYIDKAGFDTCVNFIVRFRGIFNLTTTRKTEIWFKQKYYVARGQTVTGFTWDVAIVMFKYFRFRVLFLAGLIFWHGTYMSLQTKRELLCCFFILHVFAIDTTIDADWNEEPKAFDIF